MPEIVTITGLDMLKRDKRIRLTTAIIAVGRSVMAPTPRTITEPVIAPVAAAVAPLTKALSWGLSRCRLNQGAGIIVKMYTGRKIPMDSYRDRVEELMLGKPAELLNHTLL